MPMKQKQTTESKTDKTASYFTDKTEKSIVKFQTEPDLSTKKKIFVEEIRPAFLKLIENIIYVYKFHTLGEIDTLKNDCMSFLFENLYKFNGSLGHKAFSYFNVIAKNWFIQKSKAIKKRSKSDVYMDKAILSKLENDEHDAVVTSFEDQLVREEFVLLLQEEVKKWRGKFEKSQEKRVLESVILLLDNPDLISIYNKKGIYLYIREITGLNTKQVVTNLSKVRKKYELFKKKYDSGEY